MRPSPANRNKNPERTRAEKAGRRAEALAALYLRLKGYSILERRCRTPLGEIDIVARRARLVVFVEVKQRANAQDEAMALAAVRTDRLVRAAQWFLSKNQRLAGNDIRFDVIFLAPGHWPRHLINAFGAS